MKNLFVNLLKSHSGVFFAPWVLLFVLTGIIPAISFSQSTSSLKKQSHSHQHGKGSLELTLEKNTLNGTLELPLEALLGFEHAPKTSAEKLAISTLEKNLASLHLWFTVSKNANCTESKTSFERQTNSQHSDLLYTFSFICEKPEALQELHLLFLKEYKRVQEIQVFYVNQAGQRSIVVKRNSPILRF